MVNSNDIFESNFCEDISDAKIQLVFYNWNPKYSIYVDENVFSIGTNGMDSMEDMEDKTTDSLSLRDIVELDGLCRIKIIGYTLSSVNEVTKLWCEKIKYKKNSNTSIPWYCVSL